MTATEKQWGEAFEGNREELCFILESPEKFKKKITMPSTHPILIKSESLKVELVFLKAPQGFPVCSHIWR